MLKKPQFRETRGWEAGMAIAALYEAVGERTLFYGVAALSRVC